MRRACLLALLLLLLSSCQFSRTPFERIASNTGATFAAAMLTLDYQHAGKLTRAYAQSAFQGYQSALQGLDHQLPSLMGAPDAHTIQSLLKIYRSAIQVVNHPCLDQTCGWHIQLLVLNQARQAFLKAGGA